MCHLEFGPWSSTGFSQSSHLGNCHRSGHIRFLALRLVNFCDCSQPQVAHDVEWSTVGIGGAAEDG